MDNQHLRAILLKLQDRLSDDDRRRLHFFLGNDVPRRVRDDPTLSGTLCLMESLFDQDKINEQDFTFLIHAFDEIRCIDAARVLREHMRRIQPRDVSCRTESLATIMAHTIDQNIQDDVEEDRVATPNIFIDEKNDLASYNTVVVQKNAYDNMNSGILETNTEPVVVGVSNQTEIPSPINENDVLKKSSIRKKFPLIILVVLIVLLAMTVIGLVVGIILVKSEFKDMESNCLQKRIENNERIGYLEELQVRGNATNRELMEKAKRLEDKLLITIGKTCGCKQWCSQNLSSPYGVCGDGSTCICRNEPITKENVGDGCTCDAWCRNYGHRNGGICGDGYTCICSS